MKEIRVGIIGTGIIAHQHMQKYALIPGVKVIAACDIDPKKLRAFQEKYSIEFGYEDFRELLKRDDIDAVDVCLHNNLHAPVSIAVMAAGKHCYCEKPMAGAYVDALQMKRAAERYGVKLHIQLAMIYGGQALAAKKLIDAGRLGRVYHARSYGYRRRGRPYVDGYAEKEFDSSYHAGHGALFDMGVYHISQILYLMNLPRMKKVSGSIYQELSMPAARQAESGFDVEELGVGLVKFEDDITLDIIESWAIHAGEFPTSSIHGSQGGIQLMECPPDNEKLKFFSEIENYPAETILDIQTQDYYLFRHDPKRRLYQESQAHWIGALRGECDLIDTPEIALQTMLISEGIFLSHKLGREIDAEEIPELSASLSISRQEAGFGEIVYPPYPFFE